jgi:anti-sigma regulatory factor (Ser/Thr protein kinase)
MSREPLIIESRSAELSRLTRWTSDVLGNWAAPAQTTFAVDLVVTEAVTNIISYAYTDAAVHERVADHNHLTLVARKEPEP